MKRVLFSAILILTCTLAASAAGAKYVNAFLGTAGDHGQVTPAAQLPLGLASVCPDSEPASHGGYDYEVPAISGISVTRISGVGGNGSGGNLRIRPCAKYEPLEIVKGSEKACPGYYAATLSNGVKVRLTATRNNAVESYVFPAGSKAQMYIDFNSAIEPKRSQCSYRQIGSQDFEGWCRSSTVGSAGVYTLYFRIHTDVPFRVKESDSASSLLEFPEGTRKVEVRVALSPIDEKTAGEEYEIEADRSFSSIRRAARKAWDEVLGKARVKGSTGEQKRLFYTSIYRVYLSPMDATSHDGRYRGTDGNIYSTGGEWTYYSCWSMWDTYRTKFPLLCLLSPDKMRDMCRSLVSLYCTGKKNWATEGECVPTVRTEHSQITLLDAWSKGIRDFDMAPAFPGMEREYETGKAKGAKSGLTRDRPDQKMETIYDLWAMGRIAEEIGNMEAAQKYSRESEALFDSTWTKEFMVITDDFSRMRGNGMYQGTRWQYRWAMPVFTERMIALKGEETLADELEEFFKLNMYNQGNEPDIQTPFLFNLFGAHEKTDSLVHTLLTSDSTVHIYGGNAEFPEPYVGRAFRDAADGYMLEMDEDDGTMSAWYAFSQMGFYPTCVGTDKYEVFTPLFRKIVLNLPTGKVSLVRKCGEASVSKVTADGAALEAWSVSHSTLTGSRKIVFE